MGFCGLFRVLFVLGLLEGLVLGVVVTQCAWSFGLGVGVLLGGYLCWRAWCFLGGFGEFGGDEIGFGCLKF